MYLSPTTQERIATCQQCGMTPEEIATYISGTQKNPIKLASVVKALGIQEREHFTESDRESFRRCPKCCQRTMHRGKRCVRCAARDELARQGRKTVAESIDVEGSRRRQIAAREHRAGVPQYQFRPGVI